MKTNSTPDSQSLTIEEQKSINNFKTSGGLSLSEVHYFREEELINFSKIEYPKAVSSKIEEKSKELDTELIKIILNEGTLDLVEGQQIVTLNEEQLSKAVNHMKISLKSVLS